MNGAFHCKVEGPVRIGVAEFTHLLQESAQTPHIGGLRIRSFGE